MKLTFLSAQNNGVALHGGLSFFQTNGRILLSSQKKWVRIACTNVNIGDDTQFQTTEPEETIDRGAITIFWSGIPKAIVKNHSHYSHEPTTEQLLTRVEQQVRSGRGP